LEKNAPSWSAIAKPKANSGGSAVSSSATTTLTTGASSGVAASTGSATSANANAAASDTGLASSHITGHASRVAENPLETFPFHQNAPVSIAAQADASIRLAFLASQDTKVLLQQLNALHSEPTYQVSRKIRY
jgi:C4-dicarboxylate transporter